MSIHEDMNGDLELNFAAGESPVQRSRGPALKKHSKSFKKLLRQKQLSREERARKPRLLNTAKTAPPLGALKGYDLEPVPGAQHRPSKRPKLAAKGSKQEPVALNTSPEQDGNLEATALPAAAAARKPVVFGGEAKALAELLEGDQEDTLQEAPLESTEVEEGMTDILAAVQASQLRDRQFATNSSGHIAAGYHSSEDDDENEGAACVNAPLLKASRKLQTADQNGLPSEFAEEQQHQEPVQTQTYKEGLAQSKAAKGPALQVQGPSATRSFADLGVCKSLSDHLAEHGLPAPRQIQRASLPALLSGQDVVIQNLEASGKTFSYLIAIIDKLQGLEQRISRESGTHAIILAPSVGVCVKIEASLQILLKRYFWLVGGAMHGSEARNKEKARLRKGIHVLVCTPGRLLDHLQHTEAFRTADLGWLVLDDVDQILQTDACSQLGQIFELLRERSKRPSQHWQNVIVMRKRKLTDWSALAALKMGKPVLATCREPTQPKQDASSKPSRPAKVKTKLKPGFASRGSKDGKQVKPK